VPWRTIWATIFAVLVTLVGLLLVRELSRIIAFLIVALFFAVVLTPPIDILVNRGHMRRGLATLIVFLIGVGILAALLYAFISPLVREGQKFADALPGFVDDAEAGRGPVGRVVKRFNIDKYIRENRDKLREQFQNLGTPAIGVLRKVFAGVFAAITILVLTFLILLEGPLLSQGVLTVLPGRYRGRARAVAVDSARAVSGYVFGNLVISVIAGGFTWIFLTILGVPYAGVLALWVAFSDLIPLVGATLGAIPAVFVAFLHSVPAGIATIIFFIAYQQFENHVLQVSIMAKTVKVNPLTVLVSVLVGVELFGLLGALLAIPAAGVAQVVVRDLWDHRAGRLADEPTVGADEVPASVAQEPEPQEP
jgi:predicted PurR-regulated permease PerM